MELSDATFWARLEELKQYSEHQLFVMTQMADEHLEKKTAERKKREANAPAPHYD